MQIFSLCSYVKVVGEERQRNNAEYSISRWARAVACQTKAHLRFNFSEQSNCKVIGS